MGLTRNWNILKDATQRLTDPRLAKVLITPKGQDYLSEGESQDSCETAVLQLLEDRTGGANQGEIAKETNYPYPSVAATIKRLERRGYVKVM